MKARPRPDAIIKEDCALIPIRNGDEWLWATIDLDDLERVKKYEWCMSSGRVMCKINNKTTYLYAFILNTDRLVDHRDGDKLYNRKSNLRKCTQQENVFNQHKRKDGLTSIYKGVSFDKVKKKFVVHISRDGKVRHLGYFKLPEQAAKVYDEKARELFGEFGRYNFPRANEQSVFI